MAIRPLAEPQAGGCPGILSFRHNAGALRGGCIMAAGACRQNGRVVRKGNPWAASGCDALRIHSAGSARKGLRHAPRGRYRGRGARAASRRVAALSAAKAESNRAVPRHSSDLPDSRLACDGVYCVPGRGTARAQTRQAAHVAITPWLAAFVPAFSGRGGIVRRRRFCPYPAGIGRHPTADAGPRPDPRGAESRHCCTWCETRCMRRLRSRPAPWRIV